MSVIFKCSRCENFFGKPTHFHKSYVVVIDNITGKGIEVVICDKCFEYIKNPLYGLLGLNNNTKKLEENKNED